MICAGVDAGSRAVKVLLMDADSRDVLGSGVCDQGIRQAELAAGLLDRVLAETGAAGEELACAVATGYARNNVEPADTTITEITCHARGVRHCAPEARTIVEIGGQDSKLIRLAGGGLVRDFAMNDRCAAGTGRFLEVVAERLGAEIGRLGGMSRRSRRPAVISSMCVVFAETEIIGLLAGGGEPDDIVAGVQKAVAARVAAMAGRHVEPPVLFTGGVAMISGMCEALAEALGQEVTVAPDPQMTGALGAALLAAERCADKG